MSAGNWFRTRKRQVITHTSIVVGFVLFTIFVAEPLFDRFEAIEGESPLVKISVPDETGGITWGIDFFGPTENMLEISGWAFIDGRSSEGSLVYIVLKSEERTYVFEMSMRERPDVAHAFEDSNLLWSGINGIVPLRKVESGNYTVGIYITQENAQAMHYLGEDSEVEVVK